MKKKLTILLGAGFSANANMPIANGVTNYFNRDLRKKLLNFSSGEWTWIDNKDQTTVHNGQLNYDYLGYSYVFNELLESYKAKNAGDFLNYEDFYQFVNDLFLSEEKISIIFSKAEEQLLKDYPHLADNKDINYLFLFKTKQYSKVLPILNYLIADILNPIPMGNKELIETFSPFLEYLKKFEEVNIFTLNHDLLIEKLLTLAEIPYSKGFETENSVIISNEHPLPSFTGNYNQNVRIYKLHGSIDLYRFDHLIKTGEGFYQYSGDYDYFITDNYYDKHRCQKRDLITGEIIQNFSPDIVPKFITGISKEEIIKKDKMYRKIYSDFEKSIKETENLFVSGYSFNDEHINKPLSENKTLLFINHRRSKDYPFSKNGKNIRTLNEIP
ncbi:SIR2 family protein [Myroides odoratimimus]|uniref:SIR2 family protein n=1 Tax=Myroides odoratimimus TaxID=76832 RepID=UPI002097402F|nr:SIR2 family protein [Myroides odoratimimus]MCO7724874.1 SIR2 family protein [Myroides odoratimimus]MDM1412460.1 SIR2 family protein [Myroides odoratimimus]MDM1465364.1 SIR2 family protein [Myroides odoratimimus]MDM1475354.1 SIR2 family protein [Myroides odoratimimus]MDM1485222.1 SIR2 family protein [Myroides odoratimimus]